MTNRPAPPDLNVETPPCSLCGEPTESDPVGFECPSCEIYWGQNGSNGEWLDNDAEQCDSVEWVFGRDQCWLNFGHEGKHRSRDFDWSA